MGQQLAWHDVIGAEKLQDYFQQTLNFVESERALGKAVYPPPKMFSMRFERLNLVI